MYISSAAPYSSSGPEQFVVFAGHAPPGLPALFLPFLKLQVLHFLNGLCLCCALTGSVLLQGPFWAKTCSRALTNSQCFKGNRRKKSLELWVTTSRSFLPHRAVGLRLWGWREVLPPASFSPSQSSDNHSLIYTAPNSQNCVSSCLYGGTDLWAS